jgi:hypothetical protein
MNLDFFESYLALRASHHLIYQSAPHDNRIGNDRHTLCTVGILDTKAHR